MLKNGSKLLRYSANPVKVKSCKVAALVLDIIFMQFFHPVSNKIIKTNAITITTIKNTLMVLQPSVKHQQLLMMPRR